MLNLLFNFKLYKSLHVSENYYKYRYHFPLSVSYLYRGHTHCTCTEVVSELGAKLFTGTFVLLSPVVA